MYDKIYKDYLLSPILRLMSLTTTLYEIKKESSEDKWIHILKLSSKV